MTADPETMRQITETIERDRQADRDEAVALLLAALEVDSLADLRRLVAYGRPWAELARIQRADTYRKLTS